MITRRHHTNQVTACAVCNTVVVGVSASVMGWWWLDAMHVGQP